VVIARVHHAPAMRRGGPTALYSVCLSVWSQSETVCRRDVVRADRR